MLSKAAITALQDAFTPDQLHLAGTEQFQTLNRSYLSALESDITPAAILQPKSAEEVSLFLKTIKPFALNGEANFAIRGAGQQPLPGCANIEDGITLDLGLLTGIELDLEKRIVSIAAGERWKAVYEKLHPHNLGVTGSRSGNGGIGGLALAGGLSFFSSREGLICDNVVKYELVLASGELVQASADQNPNLYKALRGGGNNFGIVTKFHMRVFDQGPFWGGSLIYEPPSFPGQIDALVHHLGNTQVETHIMISLFYAAQVLDRTLCLNQVYYTKNEENPPILDPFVRVQPQMEGANSLRLTSLRDAAAEQAGMSADGIRVAYANTTVKADAETLKKAAVIFKTHLETVKSVEGVVFSLTFQPYPLSLLEKCVECGGNTTGLTTADGPLVSILVLMNWKESTDDGLILGTAEEIIGEIDEDARERGQSVDYKYLNYADSFQHPIKSYGVVNEKFLQGVSAKVDPLGLFQRNVPGGFKLAG
ncbi:FAD-binding domain-containing protein [Xylariaceae sp. FL1272]|nr:FAD-binding domain-containing protein [Xylariaceae sp. FL1272]